MNWFDTFRVIPVLIHLSLILFSTADAGRNCYTPDGELEPNDQPCFPQNPESSCCGGSTYVCATNNMCAYYDGSYYVIGSCTDKSWNSPACPGYCFFRNHIHNTVFRCSADTYCCDDGPQCNCTTKVNTHKIADFLPEYSALVGSSVPLSTMAVTSSLMTPLGATRTAGTSLITSSGTQSTVTRDTTWMSSATTAGAMSSMGRSTDAMTSTSDTTTPSLTSSPESESSGLSKTAKVGLGMGISLGVITILLAVVLCVVLRKWKRKQAIMNVQSPPPPFQFYPAARPVSDLGAELYTHNSPKAKIYEAPGHKVSSL